MEISEPPNASPIRASIAVSWLLSKNSVRKRVARDAEQAEADDDPETRRPEGDLEAGLRASSSRPRPCARSSGRHVHPDEASGRQEAPIAKPIAVAQPRSG